MHPIALNDVIAAARPGVERLNINQFHRMIEMGILREGEPIELIDGILVRKDNSDTGGDPTTHGPRHAFCIQRLKTLEKTLAPHLVHLRQQLPITLADDREPEPDMAIVRGKVDDYLDGHPGAPDCLLVIEVADSSLEYDRTVKASIYASASVPIYVIVNIPQRVIEIYREVHPEESRYAQCETARSGDRVTLEINPGIEIAINADELLP